MDTTMSRQNNAFKNELRNELTNDIKNMMSSFFQMNTASSSGSGSLPSNTVANRRGDLKFNPQKKNITRSGFSYDGPPIPPLPKAMEREPDVTKDTEVTSFWMKSSCLTNEFNPRELMMPTLIERRPSSTREGAVLKETDIQEIEQKESQDNKQNPSMEWERAKSKSSK
ncbi:hypothetical protein Tco_0287118 [Tanacetum coccineum]